jgi:hypothetical protein
MRPSSFKTSLATAFLVAFSICVTAPAEAQYFGRNKVQYEKMDFRVLPTAHFDVHFYPAESLAASDAARMAERWYARHRTLFGRDFTKNPLIFYADHPDFQQSNVIEDILSEGTGGVTEGLRTRVIMPFTGVYAENDHVLGHELVHVFQYHIAGDTGQGLSAMNKIPLWLIEGMAEYLSLGRRDANTAMWLRDALRRNDLPTMHKLTTDPRYFPYRYGQAVWAYIAGEWGDDAVVKLYRAALDQGWENALKSVLRVSGDSLSKAWHAAIRADYAGISSLTAPDRVGRAVAVGKSRGDVNISPAISPDGRHVTFFSSRGLFGLDLYVAEVATGRIVKQLTSVTNDPHFDALSFIATAGTWSPDGRQVAFVVYKEGHSEIEIVDVTSGDRVRSIHPAGVGAINDPAWSPDGRKIAYSGSTGGISDLYLYDLVSNVNQRLTTGREAELHPAWSPEGKTIAFSTDRGPGTDFEVLSHGPMRLALIDVASRDVRLVPAMGSGKEINPQFSPDGASLYFVSDDDGVSDVYRRVLATNAVERLTRVATGVSGYTALSPAISVALKSGDMVLSVFENGSFGVRTLRPSEVTAVAASGQGGSGAQAILPGGRASATSTVSRSLSDPRTGLPAAAPRATQRYRATLSPSFATSASLGASVGGAYGAGVGGAVAIGFSDLLGNNVAQAVVQANGELRDIGAQTIYINRAQRWNWGLSAYHIPMVGAFGTIADQTFNVDGQPVQGAVLTQQVDRVYFTGGQAFTQYPLSPTRRWEIGGGAERVGFSSTVESLYVAGDFIFRRTRSDVPSQQPLSFTRGSLAYVGDYAFMGFTSPIAGGRHRFEVSPAFGSLTYQTFLADYRRYVLMRPFTLAVRGLHFGRYGSDGDSPRMQPLYVGQPALLRGYEPGDFTAQDCSAPDGAADSCPQFTRLNGSRIATTSVEFRIPVFGNEQHGLLRVPFLPLEIAPFVDAGVAWTNAQSPRWQLDRNATDRVPVVSTGVTARVNLLGALIIESYWVRPMHRPGRGAYWAFQLMPGW